MRDSARKKSLRYLTYTAAFFLNIHMALPAYFNSPFLKSMTAEWMVGLIFSFAALLAVVSLHFLPRLLARNGLLNTNILIATGTLIVLLVLANSNGPFILILAFILFFILSQLLRFNLDLYLEQISTDKATGGIRGVFMTIFNLSWLLSPYLASKIIGPEVNYQNLYFMSALALLPLIYITAAKLKEIPLAPYPHLELSRLLTRLWRHRTTHYRNIFDILVIDLILNVFYAIMVIYLSIHLLDNIGVSTGSLGIIFTIMLLPFVIFEYPLGKLSDQGLGEKELLITGLIIAGVFTLVIPFITTGSIVTWAIILFMTRVGASTIEIMKETYLFKQIDSSDVQILSLSRMFFALSYILPPIIASLLLLFAIPISFLFFILGIVVLGGLPFALRLEDTQ